MANQLEKQILEEGPRNAVVKLAGFLDTSDASWVQAIQLSDFTNNDKQGPLRALRVDEVEFSVSAAIVVKLAWNSSLPQLIAVVYNSGEFCFEEAGGILPDRTRSGFDGAINLSTHGFAAAAQGFTVLLELVKLY